MRHPAQTESRIGELFLDRLCVSPRTVPHRTLVRSGGDFLDVNGLLRRIELAGQRHMRGREVSNGFRVFDDPDGVIIVRHKDDSLGFPFRVPHGSASTPAFLDAIGAAGLRVLGCTTLVADPAGARSVLLLRRQRAERNEAATRQENKNDTAPGHPFLLLPPQPAFRPASHPPG